MTFEYHEPASIREAVELGARFGKDARFLAGGTDLMIQIHRGRCAPRHVVSLQRLPGLDAIEVNGTITLGALVTHRRIEGAPEFQDALRALVESAEVVGGHQIRNVATVGGNIANASPAADVVPALLALDASVTCAGPDGERTMPLAGFATAPGVTVLRPDELLTRVSFPRLAPRSATAFLKAGRRRAMEISVVCVAAGVTLDANLERWLEMGTDHFAIGEEAFDFLLHYQHALRDTAPELWRYGLRLKEEIEADLVRLATRLDGRPWPELVDKLRADHPGAGELVDAYVKEMARARDFVAERKLAPIPTAPLGVIPTPAFMRPVIPYAAYDSPGAYSRDRTGWFYVTVPDSRLPAAQQERILRDHCRYELAATALHEGYPGHHLQLVIAKEQPSHVRKNLWTPLTVEGWALYCEDMMGEEGFYASDEELFFQRVHLLWRAVRILLDVGLHTRGMTREQAVDQMVNDLHVERGNAEAEVRRYCAWPAYQLSYAVGRRELLRLRDDFRKAKGSHFTLRAFHDAVLPYGGIPITLIRWGLGLGE